MNIEKKNRQNLIEVVIIQTSFIAATYVFGVYLFATLVPDMWAEMNVGYGMVNVATGVAQFGNMILALVASLFVSRIGAIRTVYVSWLFQRLAKLHFISSQVHLR